MNNGGPSCPIDNPAEKKGLTRREFFSRAWWAATGLLVIETAGASLISLWPKLKAGAFGSKVKALTVDEARAMPVGTVTYFQEQRFYLARLDSGVIALYRKCPHLGCVIPWRPDESSEDGLAAEGRFNCPCHSSIFDRYGIVHGGPAPRPMDIFPISIDGDELVVDTGKVIQRNSFNEAQATKV